MVELEKHVKDLTVESNPLPVLPKKWHSNFGPKEEASAPLGYTQGEVRVDVESELRLNTPKMFWRCRRGGRGVYS